MKQSIFLFIIIIFNYSSFSQSLQHEIGVFGISTSIQSDYKERTNDLVAPYRNVGYGGGISYYISIKQEKTHWNSKTSLFENHLKLKLEALYIQNEFSHRGNSIHDLENPTESAKMYAMNGSTKIYNFGGQLEYYIIDLSKKSKINPFLSIGLHYVFFDADIESDLGDIEENPNYIPNEYLHGSLFLNKDKTQSFSIGVGANYLINNSLTFGFDLSGQRFLSDKVDGLSPKTGYNKYRDWMTAVQLGAIIKIN